MVPPAADSRRESHCGRNRHSDQFLCVFLPRSLMGLVSNATGEQTKAEEHRSSETFTCRSRLRLESLVRISPLPAGLVSLSNQGLRTPKRLPRRT